MRPIGAAGLSWADEPNLDAGTMAHLQALVDAGAQALGRARLEDAERRTRYLLRAIVDQIPLGLLIMEPDGSRPLYMNQAYTEILGVQDDLQRCDGVEVRDEAGNPTPRERRPVIRATISDE